VETSGSNNEQGLGNFSRQIEIDLVLEANGVTPNPNLEQIAVARPPVPRALNG